MACCSGVNHTITLSDDGVVHSFGQNLFDIGQLGLRHYYDVFLPTPIRDLPKILQISCGEYFTVCVDYEGLVWSFGCNNFGQLGLGNTKDYNFPKKIKGIPPVLSVACGSEHTLIITNDSNLWSCGNNMYGQLCLGNKENQSTFHQTSFSNISRTSAGYYHSLFQNNNRELFSCGANKNGELALGHFSHYELVPTLIPDVPSNIVQFVSGHRLSLFLDSEGNVFSVGFNFYGQLGLGNNTHQNVLNQIPNIPPIQSISCVGYSCYLIDFEGNLWSFGNNKCGQLGHDNRIHNNVPTKIECLKEIQQMSYGSCGNHFLIKDSQNTIFVIGSNSNGQLGIEKSQLNIYKPKEMSSQYFTIWGESINVNNRTKSARK